MMLEEIDSPVSASEGRRSSLCPDCVVAGPAVDLRGIVVVYTDDTAKDRVLVLAKRGWERKTLFGLRGKRLCSREER